MNSQPMREMSLIEEKLSELQTTIEQLQQENKELKTHVNRMEVFVNNHIVSEGE